MTCGPDRQQRRSPLCATWTVIDSELRLLAAVSRVCREHDGRVPSMTLVDELLDECGELTALPGFVSPSCARPHSLS